MHKSDTEDRGATFVVHIDEAGCEGFRFAAGSSKWFVLSAVITRKVKDQETIKLADSVRKQLGKPEKKPLHFRDLRHEQRLPFIGQIAMADLRTVSVLVHKPSLKRPEKPHERYRLYFWSLRYLFEQVSLCCKDHRTQNDSGNGSAEFIFANRSGMSDKEMREYLHLLRDKTDSSNVRIDRSIIKPDQIRVYTTGKRMGLQVADAVASSFFYAVEPSQYGYTENRYVRILKPTVYHREGHIIGYGVKFCPHEAHKILKAEELFGWV